MSQPECVHFDFFGFEPQKLEDQNDPFLVNFNSSLQQRFSEQSQNKGYDDKKTNLESHLKEMQYLNEKKNELLYTLNNPKRVEEDAEYQNQLKNIIVNTDISELDDNTDNNQTIEQYMEKDNIINKIIKQINNYNFKMKIEAEQEITHLERRILQRAWNFIYQNSSIQNANQVVISGKQLHYYYYWLLFIFQDIYNANEITECYLDMSSQELNDFQIEKITSFVFSQINQCDNIQSYKLNLSKNKLTMITNILLLIPRNIRQLALDLSDNNLQDKFFQQFYVQDNIQVLSLNICNNNELTNIALNELGKNIHIQLEIELIISHLKNIRQQDIISEYIGKCRSLKINDKQIIFNSLFSLEVIVEIFNENQFLSLVSSIMKKVIFDPLTSSVYDKIFNSKELLDRKNDTQKCSQQIDLVKDNEERQNQNGNIQQQGQVQLQQKDQENSQISSAQLFSSNIGDNDEAEQQSSDSDDVDIIQKKDLMLQVNGVIIIDTSADEYQSVLNLDQFNMDIFDDRNLYYWINSLPRIPTILLVKNYIEFEEFQKIFIQLIMSKKEKDIKINEHDIDMSQFYFNFSIFSEFSSDCNMLFWFLQQNQSIKTLEISIVNTEVSAELFKKLIECINSMSQQLRNVTIQTDLEDSIISHGVKIKGSYSLEIIKKLTRKYSSNPDTDNYSELFLINKSKSISHNHMELLKEQQKKYSMDL